MMAMGHKETPRYPSVTLGALTLAHRLDKTLNVNANILALRNQAKDGIG